MTLNNPTSRISIADLSAMDRELIREIARNQGYQRFACYHIRQNQMTLIIDTGDETDDPLPASLDCSSYYYTAKSRLILASGWQPIPPVIRKEHTELKGWKSYLPSQDLWTNHVLLLVKKDGRRTGEQGALDGFLEAMGRRFHHWIAGDEMRHFLDDTTSNEHLHAFSNMLSQVLSHEIRNPVTNLVSLSHTHELIHRDTNPDQANFALEVGRFAEQISNILQKIELLTSNQEDLTNSHQSPQIFDLQPLIHECVVSEQLSHPNYPSKVIVSVPDQPLFVNGVPKLLTLALRELVKNAFEFANGTPIKIGCYVSGSQLIIDIEDEGLPIIPGHEEMIFLRYFQGPRNSSIKSSNRRGLGLGLFLARFVSSLHAGQMLFVRGIGKKGTFRMILPLAENVTTRKAS